MTDSHMNYLQNCRKMIEAAEEIRKLGFAVYVPAWDLLHCLLIDGLEIKDLFENSFEWLKVSDAMFVLPNWKTSRGTKKEIKIAKKLKIPIFYEIEKLNSFFAK